MTNATARLRTAVVLLGCRLLAGGNCAGPEAHPPDAGLYHTHDEINRELHDLATQYRATAEVHALGNSVEGRDLWALKISAAVAQDQGEPEIVLLGCHHARESIAVDVPFLIGRHLLQNYNRDTLITRLLDHATT